MKNKNKRKKQLEVIPGLVQISPELTKYTRNLPKADDPPFQVEPRKPNVWVHLVSLA